MKSIFLLKSFDFTLGKRIVKRDSSLMCPKKKENLTTDSRTHTYIYIYYHDLYYRCPRCSAEITFKTDPKNTDYVAEHGASRNFEPWRGEDDTKGGENGAGLEEEEDLDDPMKALENRTLDSKREMEILDALDEIRLRNAKSERVNVDEVLERFTMVDKSAIEERLNQELLEDEQQAAEVFQSGDGERVRKLAEDEEPDVFSLVSKQQSNNNGSSSFKAPNTKTGTTPPTTRKAEQQNFGIAIKRKTTPQPTKTGSNPSKVTSPASTSTNNNNTQKPKSSGLSMLASYNDDDSSSDESSS